MNGKTIYVLKVETTVDEAGMLDGRVFKNYKGENVSISFSDQAQSALGLPFHGLDCLRKDLDKSKAKVKHLETRLEFARKRIEAFNNDTLWGRLSCVFGRV